MTKVFISYSRKDLAFVEHLAKDLRTAGLEVWYDLSGLDGGTRWGREIQNAIDECQSFVVVLSPNSVESDWVEKEFMYANSQKRRIIPLLYQPCKTPMWFINLHFIDVQGDNYDRNFWVILKALGVRPGDNSTKPEEKHALGSAEEIATHRELVSAQKIKFHPAWIIALVGSLALIALVVWGKPALTARLAHPPASTATPTQPSTSTPNATVTIKPTATLTEIATHTLTPMPTSTPSIGSTWTRPADGMVMVYVPEGDFSMGSNFYSNEQPIHTVSLNAYWIDKTEVTNSMYAKCVSAGSCRKPSSSSSSTRSSYYGNPLYDNYPVINIYQDNAYNYCQWAGAGVPSEAMWEKAARGTDGRIYPWGNNSPNKSLLNYNQNIGDTTAVGSYPSGASPYGALDMAGNVWEWVSDYYNQDYSTTGGDHYYVRRGGAWNVDEILVRATYRCWPYPLDLEIRSIGFRCVRDTGT
jgi:formylglycine-generating enzyme required for sulfatase activity